jgi:hypothetical protein
MLTEPGMGVSRKCLRTLINRFQAEGESRLADRSSRPHTSPSRTLAEVQDRIVELRRRERRGPDWLAAELDVPAHRISRVLVRRGQPRLCALDPMTGEVIRSSKQTAIHYERSRPGELVHMDVGKLGRIPDGGGWRAHGRLGRCSRYRRTTCRPWSQLAPRPTRPDAPPSRESGAGATRPGA